MIHIFHSYRSGFWAALLGFLLLFIGLSHSTFAQKKKKNSIEVGYGDEYFKNGDYFKAAEYYREAYTKQPNSSYVNFQLAECNRLMFNYPKAEEFYGKT